jgi:hypothetical protein
MGTGDRNLRVLLCWGYHRAGWIQPFEQLRDRFDVHYLFHRTQDEEEGCLTDAPRSYWRDFRSADEVIEALRPDRIVFMALDGAWAIALNVVARRRGIPTFIVQHGHFDHLSELRGGPAQVPITATLHQGSPFPAVRFAAASFGVLGVPTLFRVLRLMLSARRRGVMNAMVHHRFEGRMPFRYVALSPESAELHTRVDGVDADRIVCIGIPEYDRLYQQVGGQPPPDGPILLLDSPNAENRWRDTTASVTEKTTFLRSLDRIAQAEQRPLRVKLHPENYEAAWLPELQAGVYLKDVDLVQELDAATVCVGFDSTLLIPAVWLRPTILVELRPSLLAAVARETGAATVLRSLGEIDGSTLEKARRSFPDSEPRRAEFSRRLATATSGTAVETLGSVLSQGHAVSGPQGRGRVEEAREQG